jgi:2,5-diketo-D-gluconate reductase A
MRQERLVEGRHRHVGGARDPVLFEDVQLVLFARAIGVCNFSIGQLKELAATSTVLPVLNQVELHPLFNQLEMRGYCATHHIQVESWSPLTQSQGGGLLTHPMITEIATRHQRTPAQVVIRWHIEHRLVVIPKSATPSLIARTSTSSIFS